MNSITLLMGQFPVLLVYLVGIILALVYWQRHPKPCLFTLSATGLLLLVTVSQTFVTQYLIQSRAEFGWDNNKMGWMMGVVGLAGSLLRAIGIGLLLAGVFIGRRVAPSAASNNESSNADQPPNEEKGTGRKKKPGVVSAGVIALILIILASIARQWVGMHGGTDMLSRHSTDWNFYVVTSALITAGVGTLLAVFALTKREGIGAAIIGLILIMLQGLIIITKLR